MIVSFSKLPAKIKDIQSQIDEVNRGERSPRDLGLFRLPVKLDSAPNKHAFATLKYVASRNGSKSKFIFEPEILVMDKFGFYDHSEYADSYQMPTPTLSLTVVLNKCKRIIDIDMGEVVLLPDLNVPQIEELPY